MEMNYAKRKWRNFLFFRIQKIDRSVHPHCIQQFDVVELSQMMYRKVNVEFHLENIFRLFEDEFSNVSCCVNETSSIKWFYESIKYRNIFIVEMKCY